MAEKQEKTPEQLAAEKRQKALVKSDAISHLGLKMDLISNDMPIEEQMKSLSNYNEVPSIEEIKKGANSLDSYRLDFMNTLYDQYFIDFPETLERLKDKKSESNQENFLALHVLDYLYTSKDKEEDKETRRAKISAYYNILSDYQTFLINYIIRNQKWDLTKNSKEAFIPYAEIHNEFQELIKKYPGGLQTSSYIRDVRNSLFDKVINLKSTGIDDDTYNDVVNKLIAGFTALRYFLNSMAEGGPMVLSIIGSTAFQDYSLSQIYSFACEVEEKIQLDENQQNQITETKKMIDLLNKNGIGSSRSNDSGCFSMLLLLLIPASLFAYMIF